MKDCSQTMTQELRPSLFDDPKRSIFLVSDSCLSLCPPIFPGLLSGVTMCTSSQPCTRHPLSKLTSDRFIPSIKPASRIDFFSLLYDAADHPYWKHEFRRRI